MSRELCQYRVYLHKRNRAKPTAINRTLGLDSIPETFIVDGKTYYWSGLDDVLGVIVFSETDPRSSL